MQTNDQGLWFVYAKDLDEILMGCPYWPGDVMVLAFDLKFERLRVWVAAIPLLINYFVQIVHTHGFCDEAVLLGTSLGVMVRYGWEGNSRSDVTLAMRHRL